MGRKPDLKRRQQAEELRAQGLLYREIAQQLHLSVKTVETHLGHIYQKLGIRSRWQLTGRTIPDTKE